MIEGGEKELEHDGGRIEVTRRARGVSVPDGHDPPPSAQEVGLDDLSRRFGQPRHHPKPVLTNRHPRDLAEAQRPGDVGGRAVIHYHPCDRLFLFIALILITAKQSRYET
jgi:hypothetical protein